MTRNTTSQSAKQLQSRLGELRFAFIGGVIVAAILGLPIDLIVPGFNLVIALAICPLFLSLIVSSIGGLCNGRAFWWFLWGVSFFGLLTIVAIFGFISFLAVKSLYVILALLISLFIVAVFSWHWGAKRFDSETMKEVLAAKRIDIEKGTYSPFTFPFGILKTKGSKKWFVVANASGPLVISLTLIVGHWLGKYTPKAGSLWTAFCGYALAVVSVAIIRAALGEYAWIRRWEKETGRKMYISYVVDWKRYKEEEKKRRQAEQSKLRSMQN